MLCSRQVRLKLGDGRTWTWYGLADGPGYLKNDYIINGGFEIWIECLCSLVLDEEDAMRMVRYKELLSKVVEVKSSLNEDSFKRSMLRIVSNVGRVHGILKGMILLVGVGGSGGDGGLSSTTIVADFGRDVGSQGNRASLRGHGAEPLGGVPLPGEQAGVEGRPPLTGFEAAP
nr:hypothetical protein [Tanacetum cinerariifolium]